MSEAQPREVEKRERERPSRLPTDIYVIRHGSSNKAKEDERPYRERDFERELSDKGWGEAAASGHKIADELRPLMDEGAIFMLRTSPLKRTEQTLQGVATAVGEELGITEFASQFPPPPGQYRYDQPPIEQPRAQGSPLPHDKFPRRTEPKGQFSYRDPKYAFTDIIYDPHTEGMKRFGGRGGKDWKAGATLPEEWVRDPNTLGQDLRAAGIEDVSAEDVLAERTDNFKDAAHVWSTAAATLRRRWENAAEKKGKRPEMPKGYKVTEAQPPHLVIMTATHGAIVPETWLYEIIKKYEAEHPDEEVQASLGYAEYFRVHIPAGPDETPTLHIHGKTLPIPWEMFKE